MTTFFPNVYVFFAGSDTSGTTLISINRQNFASDEKWPAAYQSLQHTSGGSKLWLLVPSPEDQRNLMNSPKMPKSEEESLEDFDTSHDPARKEVTWTSLDDIYEESEAEIKPIDVRCQNLLKVMELNELNSRNVEEKKEKKRKKVKKNTACEDLLDEETKSSSQDPERDNFNFQNLREKKKKKRKKNNENSTEEGSPKKKKKKNDNGISAVQVPDKILEISQDDFMPSTVHPVYQLNGDGCDQINKKAKKKPKFAPEDSSSQDSELRMFKYPGSPKKEKTKKKNDKVISSVQIPAENSEIPLDDVKPSTLRPGSPKKKKKKNDNGISAVKVPEEILGISQDDLMPSTLNPECISVNVSNDKSSQYLGVDIFGSQTAFKKKKKKDKKTIDVGIAQTGFMETSEEIIPSSLTSDDLSRQSKLNILASPSRDGKKKRRRKEGDKSPDHCDSADVVEDMSQNDIIQSSSHLIDELSRQAKLNILASPSRDGKKKRRKKEGDKSPDHCDSADVVEDMSQNDIIQSSSHLIDELSRQAKLNILASPSRDGKKKRRRKEGDKSPGHCDSADEVEKMSQNDIIQSSSHLIDELSRQAKLNILASPSRDGKKKRRRKEGDKSPDHCDSADVVEDMSQNDIIQSSSHLIDELSRQAKLNILASPSRDGKKKRRRKEGDKSPGHCDSADEVEKMSQNDIIQSSSHLIDELSRQAKLNILASPSRDGKKKRRRKEGDKSPDHCDSADVVEDMSQNDIIQSSSHLRDELSRQAKLNILASPSRDGKKKRRRKEGDKSPDHCDSADVVEDMSQNDIIQSSSHLIDELSRQAKLNILASPSRDGKKKRRRKEGDKSPDHCDSADEVEKMSQNDIIQSSSHLIDELSRQAKLNILASPSRDGKKKRRKEGDKSPAHSDSADGVEEMSQIDIIPSSSPLIDELSEQAEFNILNSPNRDGRKESDESPARYDSGDGVEEMSQNDIIPSSYPLFDELSRQAEFDIFATPSRVRKKKRRRKEVDKSPVRCDSADGVEEICQNDLIPSSSPLIDEISRDTELNFFSTPRSRSGKKKRRRKEGDKIPANSDAPDGVVEMFDNDKKLSSPNLLDDMDSYPIYEPVKKKLIFTLADGFSQDIEAGIKDSPCARVKKKNVKEVDNESMSDPDMTDEVIAPWQESSHHLVSDVFITKRTAKQKIFSCSADKEVESDTSMKNIRDETEFSSTKTAAPKGSKSLGASSSKCKGKQKSYSRGDSLEPAESCSLITSGWENVLSKEFTSDDDLFSEQTDKDGLSEDSLKSKSQRSDSKGYVNIMEELLSDEKFSEECYSKVLEIIAETEGPSAELMERLSNLVIKIDWNVHATHQVESKIVRMPTKDEISELECLYGSMKKGRYNLSEDKIIRDNWNKFSEEYEFENPQDFFTIRYKNLYFLPHREFKNFVRYIGRGLPHRTLNSIYMRFRRLFAIREPGRLPEKMRKVFMKHVELYGKKFNGIKSVLQKSTHDLSRSAELISSSLKAKSFKSLEEKTELFKAILEATHSKSYDELKGKTINWKKVGHILNVRSESCRKYWTRYLSGYMALKKPVPKNVVRAKIIQELEKMNVECSSEVDWNKLSPRVFDLPSVFLCYAFAGDCHRARIKYNGDLWRGAIKELSALHKEKSAQGKNKVKMYPCCIFKNSKIEYLDIE
ncbi:claspin-like [Hetaerina americana]|uniref:claspin-like n=1 Tax=Hetaerina americana TaxID=62018 RepID=UPI003A7F3CCF